MKVFVSLEVVFVLFARKSEPLVKMKDEKSQKIKRVENVDKNGKCTNKINRKSLLGSSTLAIFLQPSQYHQNTGLINNNINGDGKYQKEELSAASLLSLLKDANKFMVKGSRVHESLNELRLCGWLNPYTLLLMGPSEDMKILKHSWMKRHLKNPKGYFIKDIGIVRDCIVEMIPQSPFMSLTTALFDAVADLNRQNVYPTKDTLYDYLRKQYPDIKTPETKTIHECLGRLIKNRRLYHNGRGYFILLNENVLNEVILSSRRQPSDLSEPSITGFTINTESRTSSSGQTDGHTDLDFQQMNPNKKKRAFKENGMSVTDTTLTDYPAANGSNTPGQKTVGSRFFRRNHSKPGGEKQDKNKRAPNRIFSCGLGGTPTDSIILSNSILDSPMKFPATDKKIPFLNNTDCQTFKNGDVSDSLFSDDTSFRDESIRYTTSQQRHEGRELGKNSIDGRKKVKRSKSFSGKSNKARSQKEVSFALIGSPGRDKDKEWSSDSDIHTAEVEYFKKRSFSFGVGCSRNKLQRPQVETAKIGPPLPVENGHSTHSDDLLEQSLEFDEYDSYRDIERSFVDDSVPLDRFNGQRPDMLPINGKAPLDMIHNYKDLGSALSLPAAANENSNPFTVRDLLSPTKEECLAEELKQVYDNVQPSHDAGNPEQSKDDLNSLDIKLLSPRSRKKFGTPYESQYITEVLKESESICKLLEETKKDKNSNEILPENISNKTRKQCNNTMNKNNKSTSSKDGEPSDDKTTTKVDSGGVKLRMRSKSNEERKMKQKERNSQLFEEKRASLKVMGMV